MQGSGLLGHHWVVGWDDDGLVELELAETFAASRTVSPMRRAPAPWASAASLDEAQSDALRFNTYAHLQGAKAKHCMVRGPPGVGKSALLWGLLSEASRYGLRIVQARRPLLTSPSLPLPWMMRRLLPPRSLASSADGS